MLMERDFWLLFVVQLLFSFAVSFGWSMTYLYWSHSYPLYQLALYAMLTYLVAVVTIPLMAGRKVLTRDYMAYGLLLRSATFLLAARAMGAPLDLYFIAIPFGMMLDFYWIPFNTKLMKMTAPENRAYALSLVSSPWPLTSIVGPILGGIVAVRYGFAALFHAGFVLIALSIVPLVKMNGFEMKIDFRRFVRAGWEFWPFFVIEGFWGASTMVAVPLFTLLFIRDEVSFGAVFSYLSIVAMLSTIVMGKLSDRLRRRGMFIAPLVLLASLFTLLSALSTTTAQWVLTRGFVDLFSTGIAAFTFTLIREKVRGKLDVEGVTVVSREVFLNIGRAMFCMILALSLYYWGNMRIPLFIAGLVFLIYPYLLHRKGFLWS